MHNAPAIIDRFYELIHANDAQRLSMLYAPNAEIIRYDGVASGQREIEVYYKGYLAGRPGMTLRQIDKIRDSGDVLMWDALVDSDAAGRTYAAYGGVYIVASVLWLWLVEGSRPDRWDISGAVICLIGTAVILIGPRAA